MSIRGRSTRAGRVYDVRLRGPDGREVSRTFRTTKKGTAGLLTGSRFMSGSAAESPETVRGMDAG